MRVGFGMYVSPYMMSLAFTMRAVITEVTMAQVWLCHYRSWLNAGFDSWDALAYCFHGSADVEVLD